MLIGDAWSVQCVSGNNNKYWEKWELKRLKYERFRHEIGKNNQNLEKWEIKRFRYEFGNNKKIR